MFKNKSDNLKLLLNQNLKKSKIPYFIDFTVDEWINNDRNKILSDLNNKLSKSICIRSAFALEDKSNNSLAGKFESYLNIVNKKNNIIYFVNKIIKQYSKFDKNNLLNSKIFIQNYLSKTILSGVVTNFNLHDGTPYYVINYDDISRLTNTVTSGGKSGFRVLYVYKNKLNNVRSKRFKPLVEAIKEIEKKFNFVPFDIEFAVDKNKQVYILQIRPISTKKNWKKINEKNFGSNLKKLSFQFNKLRNKNIKYSKKSVFGNMPDWNPAEMIGTFPSNLSYSLYQKLITQRSWSFARHQMDYKYVNSELMYNFSGRPYIDTRLSFHSFLPNKLNKKISNKVVNFWCSKLIAEPYLHDKIEFEIADSCYDFSLKDKIKKNYTFLNKLEKKIYLNTIKKHTVDIINNYEYNFNSYSNKLIELENYRVDLIKSIKKNKKINLKKIIIETINQIKNKGVIPFSKFARNAFIGKKILNDLVYNNVISLIDYKKLLNSLNTITSTFTKLEKNIHLNKSNKQNFNKLFYHLRAGTYDIEVERYLKKIDIYKIDNIYKILSINNNSQKLIGNSKINKLNKFLKKKKFSINASKLLNYSISSMKLRENSKYVFTRTLSDLIEIISIYGKQKNLEKKDLSSLKINQLLNKNKINKYNLRKKDSIDELNKHVQLPYLISSTKDFFVCSIQEVRPNFITNKNVIAMCVKLKKNSKINNLKNRIILIENADPGFDWIFSHKISGLITKNGGVNSHMSIRCQELNIPAAIGTGENNFNLLLGKNKLNLNCKLNKINILK